MGRVYVDPDELKSGKAKDGGAYGKQRGNDDSIVHLPYRHARARVPMLQAEGVKYESVENNEELRAKTQRGQGWEAYEAGEAKILANKAEREEAAKAKAAEREAAKAAKEEEKARKAEEKAAAKALKEEAAAAKKAERAKEAEAKKAAKAAEKAAETAKAEATTPAPITKQKTTA